MTGRSSGGRVTPTGGGVVHSFEKEFSPYRTPTARLGEDIAAAEQLELSDTARGRDQGGDVTEHLASPWGDVREHCSQRRRAQSGAASRRAGPAFFHRAGPAPPRRPPW